MPAYKPAVITVFNPPRGSGTQTTKAFPARALRATFAWGAAPGTATLTYLASDNTGIVQGSLVQIAMTSHLFYGICKSDVVNKETAGGAVRTMEFADLREFLKWDYTFCAFNKPDVRLTAGTQLKRYKHMYPADYDSWTWTYSSTPLNAFQILAAVLAGPTIGSPWLTDLTGLGEYPSGVLTFPIYDYDCLEGKRLDSALSELAQRAGAVFSLISTAAQPYRLVWTRKGGTTATLTFPLKSDNQRVGTALSENPTNVRVLGSRNQYQVMDINMIPDWSTAWEQFLVFELFADDIYNRGTDPLTGIRFNATPGDPEQYIGRQLATARALEITVREYVTLRNGQISGSGDVFNDFRKFAGRSRMEMPAALYLQTLVYRAFRPNFSFITNIAGKNVPIDSLDLLDQMLCRVSHNALTGTMTFFPAEPVDGNGYAIVKGYQVGSDLFKSIKPEQFSLDFFSDPKRAWAASSFQIDDSGEGVRFIVFDSPIIVSTNLIVDVDGQKVINANFALAVPPVKAALVFEAERFSWWLGTYPSVSRDHVENVNGLNYELVLQNGQRTEIVYADGRTAGTKANEIATAVLLRQYSYFDGGYQEVWDGKTDITLFGTQLSSLVDRISPVVSPEEGVTEAVDFANERARDNFEPERDFERKTISNTLFPGQQALRMQAETARKIAAGFRQMPFIPKLLSSLLNGTLGGTQPLQVVWFKNPTAGTLAVGTPIRKQPTTASFGTGSSNTLATLPTAVQASDSVFVGVVVRHNEDRTKPFHVQATGEVPARVMGPINENDTIGLNSPTTDNTYLVKGGTPTVGRARQRIDTAVVKLIKVDLGAGGSSGPVWLP